MKRTRHALGYTPVAYESWGARRRAAWDALTTEYGPSHADAYYHEFLPPGEKVSPAPSARTLPALIPLLAGPQSQGGEWSARELASFSKLLLEHPEKVSANLWGLLSMHLPGRTGSQCQERYEKLKSTGRLPVPGQAHPIASPAATECDASCSTDAMRPSSSVLPTPVTERLPGPLVDDKSEPTGAIASLESPVPALRYSPPLGASAISAASSTGYRPSRLSAGSSSAAPAAKAPAVKGGSAKPPLPVPKAVGATAKGCKWTRVAVLLRGSAGDSRSDDGDLPVHRCAADRDGSDEVAARAAKRRSHAPRPVGAAPGAEGPSPAMPHVQGGMASSRPLDVANACATAPAAGSALSAMALSTGLVRSAAVKSIPVKKNARPGDVIPTPTLPLPFVAVPAARSEVSCVGASGCLSPATAMATQAAALGELRARRQRLRSTFEVQVMREVGPVLNGYPTHLLPPSIHSLAAAIATYHAAHRSMPPEIGTSLGEIVHGAAHPVHGTAHPARPTGDANASSSTAAWACGGGEGAAASPSWAAALGDGVHARIASLLAAYEAGREELEQRERLQEHAMNAMAQWEAAGRPTGASGALPVFGQYAEPPISSRSAQLQAPQGLM